MLVNNEVHLHSFFKSTKNKNKKIFPENINMLIYTIVFFTSRKRIVSVLGHNAQMNIYSYKLIGKLIFEEKINL